MVDNTWCRRRLVPAATVHSVDEGLALAAAMMAGGLDVVEITFRTPVAAEAIRAIAAQFPDMAVGAGTVLDTDQLDAAIDAGASFAVAPGLNADVVRHAQRRDFLLMPGVITAGEIDHAIRLGCRQLKFFPAEVSGGTRLLAALAGPFAHTGVTFLPTGGITPDNALAYLALPFVAAVGGSWMVHAELIATAQWDQITQRCRNAVALAAGC